MKNEPSYKRIMKLAFIINIIGIVMSFSLGGNLGVFGTLLIILALILAIIGFVKKKQFDKK